MRTWTEFPTEPRLIRYADLVSMNVGGLDSEAADGVPAQHFTLIESDATNPVAADASIALPHGFNLEAERRADRGGRVGHSCTTAEVLIVHSGCWRLTFGTDDECSMDLNTGDVASIPPNRFRHWQRLDGEEGILFIVKGLKFGNGPAQRTAVLESLVDEKRWVQDGCYIDYSSGIPRMREVTGGGRDRLASPGDALGLHRINAGLVAPSELSALTARGVAEAGVISPAVTRDGFAQGAIKAQWLHGFNLRLMTLQSGAYVPRHSRAESEVILIHAGMLEVTWPDGAMMLGTGDVLSVPIGLSHALRNTTSKPSQAFIVRGSDDPATPQFDSMPTLEAFNTALRPARA